MPPLASKIDASIACHLEVLVAKYVQQMCIILLDVLYRVQRILDILLVLSLFFKFFLVMVLFGIIMSFY